MDVHLSQKPATCGHRDRISPLAVADHSSQLKLGLVTYNLAKSWDLDRIIQRCTETCFEAVELRTSHAHGGEVTLSASERAGVRTKFAAAAIELCGLGSAFEYHHADPDEVERNIAGTKEYVDLAGDVGAPAVKVRPNGLQTDAGILEDETLQQIGQALGECAGYAQGSGIRVRLEVHGRETMRIPRFRKILDLADADNLYVCWNCNQAVLEDGGLESNFDLRRPNRSRPHARPVPSGVPLEGIPWATRRLRVRRLLLCRNSGKLGPVDAYRP